MSIITRGLGKGQTLIVKGFTSILEKVIVAVEKFLGVFERLYRRRVRLRIYGPKLIEGASSLPVASAILLEGRSAASISAALNAEAETSIRQVFPVERFELESIPLVSEILATDSGGVYVETPIRRDGYFLLDLRVPKRNINSLSIGCYGPKLHARSLNLPVNQRKRVVSSRSLKISGERFGSTSEIIRDLIILDSLPDED